MDTSLQGYIDKNKLKFKNPDNIEAQKNETEFLTQLSGYALAMNEEMANIIKKAFPHSKVIDHCSVYVKLFETEDIELQ